MCKKILSKIKRDETPTYHDEQKTTNKVDKTYRSLPINLLS